MKGCFTSSRMFLSALVCAVSLALRTIMAWKDSEELNGKNFSTAASEAPSEAGHQDGSDSPFHKNNKHSDHKTWGT